MKHAAYILLLALCLALTACGSGEKTPDASTSVPGTSAAVSDVSQPEPDHSEPDASTPDASEPDLSVAETMPLLTEADKEEILDAVLAYYQGTVFEVDSITEIDTRDGDVTFQVSCSKGGVKVDPDRSISLERRDGAWTVVSEGY